MQYNTKQEKQRRNILCHELAIRAYGIGATFLAVFTTLAVKGKSSNETACAAGLWGYTHAGSAHILVRKYGKHVFVKVVRSGMAR